MRDGSAPPTSPRNRRGLTALLAANLVSVLGTRMSTLALPWFVLITTGSAAQTGLVVFAEMSPYVLIQALGGPLVDRLGQRRTSVASDLVAAVTLALVPLLHVTVGLSLPTMMVLVAVTGTARGVGDTARHVLVPALTEAAGTSLERASGWYDGVSRAGSMVGAPLAGVLIALTSAPLVVAIDAATFAISAIVIGLIVPRSSAPASAPVARVDQMGEPSDGDAAAGGYLQALREGFAHLAADRLLLGIALMILVTNLLDQAFGSVLAPVWSNDVTGSPVALGLMGAVMGLGALVGNATTAWLGHRLPRRLVFACGFLLAGCPRYFALAMASSVSPVLAVTLVAGIGAGGINPILGAVEYERVPSRLQARVLGALGATAWAGIPFGALLGGVLVERLGLSGALVLAGALYLLTTVAPFVFPAWREMDRRSDDQASEPAEASAVRPAA